MKIRVLIVDDEPHAREGITIRLREYAGIEIVGECSSGRAAVEAINDMRPDLLFLDIQMPEMNGFEVLEKITADPVPIVVFVTAYDDYAIKAFEYHALDYLLKPISEDRFRESMETALSEVKHRHLQSYANRLHAVVRQYLDLAEGGTAAEPEPSAGEGTRWLSRLVIKSKEHFSVIPVHEIDWIESAGDYVYVHANAQKHIFRESLTSLARNLDPRKFARIHRSAIVNVEKVKSLRPNEHGDFDVFLESGAKLKLSRSYRANFQTSIGTSL